MIIIFFNNLTDEQKELINKIFSDMNALFYYISYDILKNQFDAEDAVAQTFLNISDNIEKISGFSCPEIRPYCVTILRNESINILRREKKYISEENIDDLYQNSHQGEAYSLEVDFLKTVDKEILASYIDKLSEDDRTLIYLRFINELSFKQISELLDITEESAKKRGQRILKKLRAYYEEGESIVQND